MQTLNLPTFQFNFKREGKKTKIFDAIRGAYYVLTPEEWVRQNMLQFLIQHRNFPKGLISVEKGLKINGMQKRFDALAYQKNGEPILLMEYKAPQIKISQDSVDQVSRYNLNFKVPYLLISNGLNHCVAKINWEKKDFQFLQDIPYYEAL